MLKYLLIGLLAVAGFSLDPNYLYVQVKAGDKETIKDGMIIDYIDPQVYTEYLDKDLPTHTKRCFSILKVPRSWEGKLKESVNEKEQYSRSGFVDFKELEKLTGVKDYEKDMRDSKPTEILDVTGLNDTIIKDTKDYVLKEIFDFNAVSSGNYPVGGGGAGVDSYATWAAATADIANLTGNLTFTQTSDLTETATSTITENYGGFNLTYTSNSAHNGNPAAGHKTNLNGDVVLWQVGGEGPGNIYITGLYVVVTINSNPGRTVVYTIGIDAECGVYIYNNLFDGQENNGGYAITQSDSTAKDYIFNNVVWGFEGGGIRVLDGAAGRTFIENNTCYKNGIGFTGSNDAIVLTNNLSVGNTTDFTTVGNATGNNNGCSDATCENGDFSSGSNNAPNLTIANEVRTTDSTNALFMKVKTGGTIDDGGTTAGIAANTTGIRGNVQPNANSVNSIGADQLGSITVTAPNGSESWTTGTSQNITWTSANIDGLVKIEYSNNSGSTYATSLATGETNDGTYAWTIAQPANTLSRIQITSENDTGIKDGSNADFSILAAATTGLTGPLKYSRWPWWSKKLLGVQRTYK